MALSGIMSGSLANKLINHVLRNTPYYTSGCVYAALYLESPGEDNSGSEVFESNYARAPAYSGTGIFTVAGSYAYNSGCIVFPKASGSWGVVTHFGLLSASQSGSLLFYGQLSSGSGMVNAGDIVRFTYRQLYLWTYGQISEQLSGSILNFVLKNASFTTPGSSVYAGLLTTSGCQVSSASSYGYSRIPMGGTSFWSSPTGGSTTSASPITFTNSASSAWGAVKYVRIYSASAGDEWLFSSTMPHAKTVNRYDGFYLPVGAINLSIDTRNTSLEVEAGSGSPGFSEY